MDIKRVLVTGGTGILGKAIMETCPPNIQLFITHWEKSWAEDLPCPVKLLDVTDRENTLRTITDWEKPDVVIHAAGIANVDLAEKERSLAKGINVDGTKNVINACLSNGIKLIYVSTNAVFDGNNPPYSENSERNPVNYYGKLKVEAENLVIDSGLEFSIVRAILMYGWHFNQSRPNPVTNWIRLLSEGKTINVVDDRYTQPLYAYDCANTLWEIVNQDRTGIYNVSGADRVNLFEFAMKTADIFELNKELIQPVPSTYFPEIAPRPIDTSYSISKVIKELNIHPMGIEEGLTHMKASKSSK